MKKVIKRIAARFLCVTLVLTMCIPFASAGYGDKAGQSFQYNTLDEIPEDVDIFRAIRGNFKGIRINGDLYYEFWRSGYPTVRIKASAFTTKPTNGYLDADNKALSENCKNPPPKGEDVGGAKRVCYYKTWSEGCPGTPYIFSMYRLELRADARDCENVYVGVKLTSAVTFAYYATSEVLRSVPIIPIRPSVSVVKSDDSSNASFHTCKIVEGIGKYHPEVSEAEKATAIYNVGMCATSVVGAIGGPELWPTIVSSCTPVVIDAAAYSYKLGHYSADPDDSIPWKYPYKEVVTSPVQLQLSDDSVVMHYTLYDCLNPDSVNFRIAFSFTSELIP